MKEKIIATRQNWLPMPLSRTHLFGLKTRDFPYQSLRKIPVRCMFLTRHSVWLERNKRRSSANRCAISRLLPRVRFVAGDLKPGYPASGIGTIGPSASLFCCGVPSCPENPYPAANDYAWGLLSQCSLFTLPHWCRPAASRVGGDCRRSSWQLGSSKGWEECPRVASSCFSELYPTLDATTSSLRGRIGNRCVPRLAFQMSALYSPIYRGYKP